MCVSRKMKEKWHGMVFNIYLMFGPIYYLGNTVSITCAQTIGCNSVISYWMVLIFV